MTSRPTAVLASFWATALPVLMAAVLWVPGLASGSIINGDDAFYAMVVRGLIEGRSDLVSTLGWRMPLFYWLGLGTTSITGLNELGLRLPSLICGLLVVGATARLGQRLWPLRPAIGLWAGALLATTGQLFMFARRVRGLDLCLTACGLVALILAIDAGQRRGRWLLVGVAVGLGFLTKSVAVAAFAPPLLLIWWRAGESLVQRLRSAAYVAVGALATAGPWLVYVLLSGRTRGLQQHFATHVGDRATGAPLVGEVHGPEFYVQVLLDHEGLLGALFLLALGCWAAIVVLRPEHRQAGGVLVAWAAGVLVLFGLAATKLPHYILPAYPALALATISLPMAASSARLGAAATHLWAAALVLLAWFGSPIAIAQGWGEGDWSPQHKAGARAARGHLPPDGRLWVLNEYHLAAAYYFDGDTRLLTTEPEMAAVYDSTRGFQAGVSHELIDWAQVAARIDGPPPSCLLVSAGRAPPDLDAALSPRFATFDLPHARLYCAR